MKNKIIIGVLMLFACFALTGCGCSKREYQVTFDSKGGSSVSNQVVKQGEVVIEPEDPTKDGYSFGGWYLDLDDANKFDFNTKIDKDITLYAKWNSNDENAGGEQPCTRVCESGYTLDSSTCTCIKDSSNDDDSKGNTPTVPVTGLTVDKTEVSLKVNQTAKVTATVTPSNATNKTVSWKSSNTKVATVSKGTITAKGEGTATITATAGGKSVTITVTVSGVANKDVTKVSVSGDKTVKVGSTIKLTATITPSDATDKTVTWSSSDTKIATVSGGTVTGVKAGKVTITACSKSNPSVCGKYEVSVEQAKYTYTVTAVTEELGASFQSKIKIFEGNTDITAKVQYVYAGTTYLGAYNSSYKALLVNTNETGKINRILFNDGTWADVTEKK